MRDSSFHADGSDGSHEAEVLMRRAADGELSATDQARFDDLLAGDPSIAHQVAFEQRLRESTGRTMADVAVPMGLADRVLAAIQADEDLGASLEEIAEQTRRPSFWSRTSIRSAAAAVFVLGLSAALIYQATRLSSVPLDPGQMAYRQQLAGFLTGQHDRFCDDIAKDALKTLMSDSASFEALMTSSFGHPVDVPESPAKEVRFAGGGPCHVPGDGPSGHGVYRADFGPEISVFVKPDNGELPLKPGRTYALKTKECGLEGAQILALVKDGVIYYFVFNEAPGCQKALQALGVAAPSAKF